MKTRNQNRIKGLMLGSALFAASFSAFAATEDGVDIGAVQTAEKGWVEVKATTGTTEYVYPARIPASLNWAIIPKPAINVNVADFQWVIGAITDNQAKASVVWKNPDGKTAKMFDATLPEEVTLKNIALPQLFFAAGSWTEKKTLIFNPSGDRTVTIVPEVTQTSGEAKDDALTAAIAAEASNYTYTIDPAVAGFSVDAGGTVTITQGTIGSCTVKVKLDAADAKWPAISEQVITIEVTPITLASIDWVVPSPEATYTGLAQTVTATGKYDTNKTVPLTVSLGEGITSATNAGNYTATAAIPAGYNYSGELVNNFTIKTAPVTQWTSAPVIPGFNFGTTPVVADLKFLTDGVNEEKITVQITAAEYTPWISTVYSITPNITTGIAVAGGQAEAANYNFTAADLQTPVTMNSTALTLTVTPQRTVAYIGESAKTLLTPVIGGAESAPKAFLDEVETALTLSSASNEYFDISDKKVTGKKVTEIPQDVSAALAGSEYKFESVTSVTYATVEVLEQTLTNNTEVYFTVNGSGDGAIGNPANISRLKEGLLLTAPRDIRIVNANDDKLIITDDLIFSDAKTLSSGWVITGETAVQNPARAAIVKGALTLINGAKLNKIVVDATGKTVSISGGTLDNVTLKVANEITLPSMTVTNAVIYGAAVTKGSAALSNSAYQVANDDDGGTVDGTNLLLSASGDFSAKINDGAEGNYKPMNSTEGNGKASILINRGSTVTTPAQTDIIADI